MKRAFSMLSAAVLLGACLLPGGNPSASAQEPESIAVPPPTVSPPMPGEHFEAAAPEPDEMSGPAPRIRVEVAPVPGVGGTLMFVRDGEGSTWLGVHIVPVPKALASQLRIEGPALMVQNVAKGSPADEGGIEQFDVLVEVDGKPVPETVPQFTEQVRKYPPNATIKLRLVRQGEKRNISVTLREMPRSERLEYKYEPDPDAILRDAYGIRGKILRPLPGGGYRLEDLGDLPDLPEIAPFYLNPPQRPGEPPRQFTIPLPDPDSRRQREWSGRWTRPEGTIQLHVDANGRITVRRPKESGAQKQEDVHVFPDAEALKKADPDAYELYKKLDAGRRPGDVLQYRVPDREELRKRVKEWEKAFRDRIEDLDRRKGDAAQEFDKRMREFERWLDERKSEERAPVAPRARTATSFSVDPSGRISATVRDGDSEITRQFENEEQFKAKAPELYRRYQEMNERLR